MFDQSNVTKVKKHLLVYTPYQLPAFQIKYNLEMYPILSQFTPISNSVPMRLILEFTKLLRISEYLSPEQVTVQ